MQFQMISFIMYYHYIFFILRLECLADREIIEIERGDCSNSGNSKNASLCLSYESEIVKFSTKKYKTSYLSHPERPNVSSGLVHFEFGSNSFSSGSTIRYQDLVCRLISYIQIAYLSSFRIPDQNYSSYGDSFGSILFTTGSGIRTDPGGNFRMTEVGRYKEEKGKKR